MSKKQRVYLPSLKKSTSEKIQTFPLTEKLSKANVKLLEEHGYEVKQNVKTLQYSVLPPSAMTPFLLFMYMLLQDVMKGKLFNELRYYYYLMFLQAIYQKPLSEKQELKLDKYLTEKGPKDIQVNGRVIRFVSRSTAEAMKTKSSPPVGKQEIADPFPLQKKVIILSSDYAGTGKTTFSNSLVEHLGEDKATKLAIADEIRSQLAYIFSVSGIAPTAFLAENYNKTKNDSHSYDERFKPFVLRELICDYSDVMQKHFGDSYWASLAEDFIKDTDYEVFVIDDVRRPIEFDYLRKQFGADNVLTVYLTKQDSVKPVLTGSAVNYEGLLNPTDFDIQFEFNSDWSNSTDLIKTITERL